MKNTLNISTNQDKEKAKNSGLKEDIILDKQSLL
jgi:hypothetical protein